MKLTTEQLRLDLEEWTASGRRLLARGMVRVLLGESAASLTTKRDIERSYRAVVEILAEQLAHTTKELESALSGAARMRLALETIATSTGDDALRQFCDAAIEGREPPKGGHGS